MSEKSTNKKSKLQLKLEAAKKKKEEDELNNKKLTSGKMISI